jgi:hypothetical protein
VRTEDMSLEQELPVAILTLGNFTCLNWKTVVGRRESGPVVTRSAPNYDMHLICPVESSPVFHFQLQSGVT